MVVLNPDLLPGDLVSGAVMAAIVLLLMLVR